MILDERTEFCDATSLNTGGAGSYLIGDVIDSGSVVRDLGRGGRPIYFVVTVSTSVTSAGSATVQFHLASDAQAAIATDGTASYHLSSGAIAKATLVAGYNVIAAAVPMAGTAYERYLGVLQTTAVAALTAGAVDAFLTLSVPKHQVYNNAI